MRATAATVIAALLLTLAACSDDQPASTAEVEAIEVGDQLTAAQYYDHVRENIPVFANSDDEALDRIAEEVCQVFRDNGDEGSLLYLAAATEGGDGLNGDEAGQLMAYAVYRACPELDGHLISNQ